MLHIDIIDVVTCSDNSSRRIFTCIIGSFSSIHFIITTQFHCFNVSITIREKKVKFNKMLSIVVDNAAANEQLTVNITSNFPQYCTITGIGRNNSRDICHVLQFHAIEFWWSISFMSVIFSTPSNQLRHPNSIMALQICLLLDLLLLLIAPSDMLCLVFATANNASLCQRPSFEHASVTFYILLWHSITLSIFHSEVYIYCNIIFSWKSCTLP